MATIRRALELAINFFDAAPLYWHGKMEMRMGEGLAGTAPDSRVLAAKVGRVLQPVEPGTLEKDEFDNPAPFRPVFDFSYDGVMHSFNESLKRLNLDRVDILHIHDPDDYHEQAIEGAYPTLDQLRKEGRIKAVGAGMNQSEMLPRFARATRFP